MLPNFNYMHAFFLATAIVLEILAIILMKLSLGLTKKVYVIAAIICVMAAFTALSQAIYGIQLSVAYAIWGGVGLIATAVIGMRYFNERLTLLGVLGIGCIISGIILLKWA